MNGTRSFRAIFGCDPLFAGRAHGRVNLLGDHTDYNQGFVLPTIIPQETIVEAAPGETGHEIYSATLDRIVRFDDGPLTDFARYIGGCVRVIASRGQIVPPLHWRIASTVPVGAGLSSSAALEVATIRVLDAVLGLKLDAEEVAMLAHEAETRYAGVACGIMDQMACSIGVAERMLFLDTMTLERRLLPLPQGAELAVIDSGIERSLADSQYNQRRAECEAAAARLGVPSLRQVTDAAALGVLPDLLKARARHVVSENARVVAALDADAAAFGALMNASHASLRDDFAVSLPAIDALVAALQQEPRCFGARLTGAGFGGCCVALVARGAASDIARQVLARAASHPRCRVIVPPQESALGAG